MPATGDPFSFRHNVDRELCDSFPAERFANGELRDLPPTLTLQPQNMEFRVLNPKLRPQNLKLQPQNLKLQPQNSEL
jgi:hypothetical protein